MTMETDERTGACQVSKVEVEENLSSNLSSYDDLGKVGGECNGIVHDGLQQIDDDVKEDGDGSYVFVDGPDAVSDELEQKDLVAEPVADPARTVKILSAVEGETVCKSIVDSDSGEKQLEVGELTIEKANLDQFPMVHKCNMDGSLVSSSTSNTAAENSICQPEASLLEKNDMDNEQNEAVVAPDSVVSQESVLATTAESELPRLDDEVEKQNGPVPVESGEVEENKESITVKDAIERELRLFDNEDKVKEVEVVEKIEEQRKLDSATEFEENEPQESEMVKNASDIEQNKAAVAPGVVDNQESMFMTAEAAGSKSALGVVSYQESICTTKVAVDFKLPHLEFDEVEEQSGTVPLSEVESGEAEEIKELITVEDAVECELQQFDNAEKAEEDDSVEKNNERSKLDSATKVDDNQAEWSEMEKNASDIEQNKAAVAPGVVDIQESMLVTTDAAESKLALDLVCKQESIFTAKEAVDSKLPHLERDEVEEQNRTVPLTEVESGAAEENKESVTVEDAVECELQQFDKAEKVEEDENLEKNEEQSKLDSATNFDVENQTEWSELGKIALDNGQSKGVLGSDVEGNQEPAKFVCNYRTTKEIQTDIGERNTFTMIDAVQFKLPHCEEVDKQNGIIPLAERESGDVAEKQNGIIPLAERESGDVEENKESITVSEAVECELQQLDDDEKVEVIGNVEKKEEQYIFDSAPEVKENQDAEMMVRYAVVSGSHQLHNGEGDPEEPRKLDLVIEEENQLSRIIDEKDIELEVGQLDNRDAMDSEVSDETSVNDLSSGSEAATGPINMQLEGEALSGSIESGESLPGGPAASETEVINDLAVSNGEMACSTHIESKFENVDGSTKISESLAHLVDEVEQESGVRNMYVENGKILPTDTVDKMIVEVEVKIPTVEITDSLPVECSNLETVVTNSSTDVVESKTTCIDGDGKLEVDIISGSVEGGISIANCSTDAAEVESEDLNCSVENGIILPTCDVANVELVSQAGNGSGASADAPSSDSFNLGSVVQDDSVENGEVETHSVNDCENEERQSTDDAPSADSFNLGAVVQDDSVENGEVETHSVNDCENEERQSTDEDSDNKPVSQEVDTGGIQGDKFPQSSPKGSLSDVVDEEKVDTEVVKKPSNFLIKIPRFVDAKLREQIDLTQLQVEEKTRSRDAIGATIQTARATCNEYRLKFEAAKSEERIARDALIAKRQEIDSVQSAISIDDIDERILNMERMMIHETRPLKEEKQIIREIKQLKNLRVQLASHMGKQDERQQAPDQRDRIGDRLKLLKQEVEALRKKVSQTEGIRKVAREKYFGENEKLRELQSQFKAADDLRQEAYAHLQSLRNELYEKSKYFRMYKDDQRAANNCAAAGDREALQHLCANHMERVMELWNKNDEFRKEYIRCNTVSTLRRLGTLDGRSLGPDEKPPVMHTVVDERVDNALAASSHKDSALVIPPSEPQKSVVPSGAEKGDVKTVLKVQRENPTAKLKKASKPTALENGSATFSGREEKEEVEEENKKSKEEEELARKAEELRREEAAARLKEQHRLEEKVKAKEAEERKRRNAEKAQAKAELRAKKEAELKEKQREKRAKKKEKKKAAVAEGATVGTEGESAASTENATSETTASELEIKEKTMPVKRPQKPSLLAKQTKTKPVPPPLRNKGKRRMQTWMWVLIIILVLLALFLGSVGVSFRFALPSFGF